jgi:hypothetical protein
MSMSLLLAVAWPLCSTRSTGLLVLDRSSRARRAHGPAQASAAGADPGCARPRVTVSGNPAVLAARFRRSGARPRPDVGGHPPRPRDCVGSGRAGACGTRSSVPWSSSTRVQPGVGEREHQQAAGCIRSPPRTRASPGRAGRPDLGVRTGSDSQVGRPSGRPGSWATDGRGSVRRPAPTSARSGGRRHGRGTGDAGARTRRRRRPAPGRRTAHPCRTRPAAAGRRLRPAGSCRSADPEPGHQPVPADQTSSSSSTLVTTRSRCRTR